MKPFQILFHLELFHMLTHWFHFNVQFFSQHKDQETTKHMASYGFIGLVIDRLRFKNTIYIPEQVM